MTTKRSIGTLVSLCLLLGADVTRAENVLTSVSAGEVPGMMRRFRIQTYEQLQHNRAEYDRYMQAATRIYQAYKARGQTESDRADLLLWLKSVRPGVHLPAAPEWVKRVSAGKQGTQFDPAVRAWKGERVGPSRSSPPRRTLGQSHFATPLLAKPPLATRLGIRARDLHGVVVTPSPRLPDRVAVSPRNRSRQIQPASATELPPGTELVDVKELAHRVAGFNEAIRSWEGLATQERNWSLERLQAAIEELEEWEGRREMHELYRKSLSQASRSLIPSHRSTSELKHALQARWRELHASPRYSTTDARHKLEQLQRRLQQLTTLAAQRMPSGGSAGGTSQAKWIQSKTPGNERPPEAPHQP